MAASLFKRLVVGIMWLPPAALAAQAPDSTVVTGPNFQQIDVNNLMVTPTGGTQTKLSDALATASGNVIPSPQYRIGFFPNSGTANVISGSSSITTDGSGNLNVGGLTTLSGGAMLGGPLHMGANTLDGSAVAFTGGSLSGIGISGGSIGGTIIGTPTLSGAWTFSGGLTGTLTGHSSLDLALTGGTVTGNTTFSNAGQALKVNDTALFGAGGTQTLAINGNSITTGGSTALVQLKLATSAPQIFAIKGTDEATPTPHVVDIIDITGSTLSNTVVHNALQVVGNVPTNYALYGLGTLTGTASAAYSPINFIYTDNMNSPGNSGIMSIQETQSSSAAMGSRLTFAAGFHLTGTSGNTTCIGQNCGGNYVGGTFSATASANDNGTAAHFGTINAQSGGAYFGANILAHLFPGATYAGGVIGAEFDVQVEPGASTNNRQGISVVLIGDGTGQGAWEDNAFIFGGGGVNQSAGSGWLNGIAFGRPQSTFPFDPVNGVLITAGPVVQSTMITDIGVNFLLPTFNTAAFRSKNFVVDGSGVTRIGSGAIAYTGSGISLDVNYVHGLAEGTVISGGTIVSGGTAEWNLNVVLYDACNGAYNVTGVSAANGVVNQLTVLRQSFCPVGTSATVTLSPKNYGGGTGTVQITQTWTTDSVLSLQPGGGLLTIGGARADKQTVVASLPTCNSGAKGYAYVVTDSNTTTFNATLAGGGSNVVGALCNGTNWTVH